MAKTNKQSSKSQVMIKVMKWTDKHDLELIKEILTERPFDNPQGSRRIGLVWERIVDNLNSRADIVFNLKDIRAVRDRYNLLAKKYKKKEREEINAVALFESQEEEREKEKTAKDEDRSKQKMPDWSHLKLLEKQQKEKHQETIRSEPRKQLL
ncbi:Hypothetical predicted protein [Paramuricea clavata]|uniref:Uncharacterized protein n=1 Tax=Paramuricea clavata TaxID=317549 RepID=A0A7D9HMC2_PARCT|nr:Hypothetical predicted protein [Paramuricea clavata]